MIQILQDEHLWVYLSLIVFVVIFGKIIYKYVLNFLLQEIALIKNNITKSNIALEESIKNIKQQKSNLSLLNQRIQAIKKTDKDNTTILIETFYDNLYVKLQYLENNFKSYLEHNDHSCRNKLANVLIDESTSLTINILKTHLKEKQKKEILDKSIEKISSLSNLQIINE